MDPTDRLTQNLRDAEDEIDSVHRKNPLIHYPFGDAAWRFLAANEERVMREIVRAQQTGNPRHPQEYAALFDSVVASTKWPMRWLLRSCRTGGRIPNTFDDDSYRAAMDLSGLGQSYSHFEAAFTYASLGVLTLRVDGRHIHASDEFRRDTRFDAYDRLRQPHSTDNAAEGADSLIESLGRTVRVNGQWFYYDTGPNLVSMALEALAPLINSRFRLPDDWKFATFSLDDFRAVTRVIFALAYLHFNARVIAAAQGCIGLGYARALLTTTRRELLNRIRDHTTVDRDVAPAIIETLTFGARDQRNPDPALQPLISLTSKQLAIAPNLVLNSSMERNFAVLLNRLPEERALYSTLSKDREGLSRDRLIGSLRELGYRHWYGRISEWGPAAEIDLVIISDEDRCALGLEMKAFLGPADPREVHERSLEIKRGIDQATERLAKTRDLPRPLLRALGVEDGYEVVWAVASETSIGAPYVQSDHVPVVQAQHLVDKLRREGRLAPVCEWLKASEYLPIEGTHFQTVDFTASVGDWNLPWYGIKGLADDFV